MRLSALGSYAAAAAAFAVSSVHVTCASPANTKLDEDHSAAEATTFDSGNVDLNDYIRWEQDLGTVPSTFAHSTISIEPQGIYQVPAMIAPSEYSSVLRYLDSRRRLVLPTYSTFDGAMTLHFYYSSSIHTLEYYVKHTDDHLQFGTLAVLDDLPGFLQDLAIASDEYDMSLTSLIDCTRVIIDEDGDFPRLALLPHCARTTHKRTLADLIDEFLLNIIRINEGNISFEEVMAKTPIRMIAPTIGSIFTSFAYSLHEDMEHNIQFTESVNDLSTLLEKYETYKAGSDNSENDDDNVNGDSLNVVSSVSELNDMGIYLYGNTSVTMFGLKPLMLDYTECENDREQLLSDFLLIDNYNVAVIMAVLKEDDMCTVIYDHLEPPVYNDGENSNKDTFHVKDRVKNILITMTDLLEIGFYISPFSLSVRNTEDYGFLFVPRLDDLEQFTNDKDEKLFREIGVIFALGRIYGGAFFEGYTNYPCTLLWYKQYVTDGVRDVENDPFLSKFLESLDKYERDLVVKCLNPDPDMKLDELLDHEAWTHNLDSLPIFDEYDDEMHLSVFDGLKSICSTSLEKRIKPHNNLVIPVYDISYYREILDFFLTTNFRGTVLKATVGIHETDGIVLIITIERYDQSKVVQALEAMSNNNLVFLPYSMKSLNGLVMLKSFKPNKVNTAFDIALSKQICRSLHQFPHDYADPYCKETLNMFCTVPRNLYPLNANEIPNGNKIINTLDNCSTKTWLNALAHPLEPEKKNAFVSVNAYYNQLTFESAKTQDDANLISSLFSKIYSPSFRRRGKFESTKSKLSQSESA